jgi:hypothetical protein
MAALLGISLLLLLLGSGWAAHAVTPRQGWEIRLATAWLAGLVFLGLVLLATGLMGLRWGLAWLGPLLAAGVAASLLVLKRRPEPSSPRAAFAFGWGDAVAAAVLLAFAFCTVQMWNLNSDFIYHWGIKGKTFALARGIDVHFLSRPWNAHLHSDYPNLVPALFALTALWDGGFREPVMASWSVAWFALLLLFARDLLAQLGVSPWARQAGVAVLALTLCMFGVGYLMAGSPDWLIALALLVAAGPLLAEPSRAADHRLGIGAAVAAASKIEGMPLAAILIAVHLVRRAAARPGWRPFLAAALTAGLPSLAAFAVWAWPAWRFHLFQTQVGDLRWSRLAVVLPELWRALLTVNWHFLPLCLLALPLLALDRRFRSVALACLLQGAFYLFVYLAAPVDTRLYVQTSAARLFFHLVPAVMMLLVAWLDGAPGRGSRIPPCPPPAVPGSSLS